jgi:hypothetical protein
MTYYGKLVLTVMAALKGKQLDDKSLFDLKLTLAKRLIVA